MITQKIITWSPLVSLPLAFLSWVIPINEYKSMGISAIDCDGPLGVMIFALPALIISLIGTLFFVISLFKNFKKLYIVLFFISLLSLSIAFTRVVEAYKEHTHNLQYNIETCGDGW